MTKVPLNGWEYVGKPWVSFAPSFNPVHLDPVPALSIRACECAACL